MPDLKNRLIVIRDALASLLLAAALVTAAAAVLLCLRARALPLYIPAGVDEPAAVIDRFFSALRREDFEAAYACLSDGASLGLESVPEDGAGARLWLAQRGAWDYEIADGYGLSGTGLTRRVTVTAPDFSGAGAQLREYVQARLEAEMEAAVFGSEVLDESGGYREELVMAALDEAIDALAADPSACLRRLSLTVHLEYANGEWKLVPRASLITALTGGAVRGVDPGTPGAAAESYGMFVNNLVSEALEGLVVVPKVYWLPETAAAAPKPVQTAFGSSKKAADTAAALEQSAALLAGKHLLWSPDATTEPGRTIKWYADETIFTVCWREKLDLMTFNFCEVVIGHPSQFRRYIAENSFQSGRRFKPTQMARTVNAVAALSGDFIKYRRLGICVYQRALCRAESKKLDTCFVNAAGDLLFVRRGALKSEEAVRQYIEDNDVVFSLAFGPIMIENGASALPKGRYPVGQPNESYTRCVLCQLEECHYLLVTVNVSSARATTLARVTKVLLGMGVPKAYALDGGQTASLIINNELFNTVDFNQERTMSDILYFATALPEGG